MRRNPLVYLCLSITASLLAVGLMPSLRTPASQAAPSPQGFLPDLAISKYRVDKCPGRSGGNLPIPPFAPGQEIAYEYYFVNQSDQVAHDVRIVAQMPSWTTYVNSSGPGFVLVQAGPDQVVWVRDRLSGFERGWLCITVRVDADAPVGARVEDRARILGLDAESAYSNNEHIVADYILPATADLTVMSDLHPNSASPAPGGQLSYRIATLNRGGATAQNLRITDTLPLSATFVSESHPVGFTTQLTGSTVVWTAPSMAGNYPNRGLTPSDQDLTLTVQLSDDFDPAAHWLENVVEISTTDPEYSTANNLNRFALKPEADQLCAAAVTSVDDRTMQLLNDGAYDWMVYYLDWSQVEPADGHYNWVYLHDAIWKAWQYHLKLVVRVDRAPAWARSNSDPSAPPDDPNDLRDFLQAVTAARDVPQIAGFIIWNEPNLAAEWGGDPPDAAAYTALLQAAYNGVQATDADVLVISAGLAPTNGDPPNAVDDRTFLQDMYSAGAGSYFDMLGVNPLGFASAPDDTADPNHYHFARTLEWRTIMEANGDAGKQMFATELGWLRDTENDLGGYNWIKVSEIDQAHYLTRAYHKARCEMPWMGPMSTWNLDFAGFYADTEHLHWYAVTDQNRDPLRAYLTLQNAATHGPGDLWVELELLDPIEQAQDFRYRLRYTNIGGQTAAGVTLTDTLPAGTEYVSDTGGGALDGDQVVWDLGNVDLCAYQTITLTARLSGSGSSGGLLINTVEASTVLGEPYTDDNLAQVTTPVDEPPDPPTLLSPADNSRISDNTPTLTWTASPSPDAADYLLDLDGDVLDMDDAVQYTSGVLADGTHTWTVAAYDDGGNIGTYPAFWSFTVDTEPPIVLVVSPADGSLEVELTAPVIITFSESIDAGTFAFTTTPDPGGWSVTWSHGHSVAALSHNPLARSQTHTVTITSAEDLLGHPLAGTPYDWSFTAEPYHAYLPLAARNHVVTPDLMVDRVVATFNQVQVVTKNVGKAAVMDHSWVDAYLDPASSPPPATSTIPVGARFPRPPSPAR